jgi:UDP-2,3-diacylglucosamine pyrophosphatase LpxH
MAAEPGYRSVFLSDLHLGSPDCQAAYLLDFLERLRCEQLYLVGDIIDLQALARRPFWPSAHGAVLAHLLALPAQGVRVRYIPGNHDAAFRTLAGSRIGAIEVCREAIHVGADGRRFRVSHGDEFDEEGLGRSWLARIGDSGHRLLCFLNRHFNRLRRRAGLPYFPLAVHAKSRIGRALAFIHGFEQRAAARAQSEGLDGQICGHIHFAAIRTIGSCLYLNCGDFVEHCTALAENGDGGFELLHWTERKAVLAEEALRAPAFSAATAFTAFAAMQQVKELDLAA